jgi:hypothetical protein
MVGQNRGEINQCHREDPLRCYRSSKESISVGWVSIYLLFIIL